MIYSGLLVVAVLAAYLLQDAVASFAGAALAICGVGPAALEWMHHGRLLLLPALFFAACVTVPFPGSLDVFTQQMDPGDPLLKLYSKTAGQVAEA